jgi:hypothetical protein
MRTIERKCRYIRKYSRKSRSNNNNMAFNKVFATSLLFAGASATIKSQTRHNGKVVTVSLDEVRGFNLFEVILSLM